MDLEQIIGIKNPDGTRKLPALNVYGKPYRAGAVTTIGVAPGKFVVAPPNFSDDELLKAVREAVNPPEEPTPTPVKREKTSNAGE